MSNLNNIQKIEPGQKFFLTKRGLEEIKKEYEKLKAIKVVKTNSEGPKILHSDDLDPEYRDFQEDLNLLESRLTSLEYVIKNAQLIKPPAKEVQKTVQLGAKVALEVNGQNNEFLIVGTIEADPSLGRVSNDSPVGKALIGRRVGEEVVLESPIKTHYKIKEINYSL